MNSKESKKNPVAAFFGAIGKSLRNLVRLPPKGTVQ